MKIISDFHLHSSYSRATSRDMNLDGISKGAKAKGLNLLGTGDFTFKHWLEELRRLEPIEGTGLFKYNNIYWMLTSEVNTTYELDNKSRKVHHLIHAPSFDVVEQINEQLSKFGNLLSDGRPTLDITPPELVEIVMNISKDAFIVPAHLWTSWFGALGEYSGFNSLEECYQDQLKHIYAFETGMSCYDGETEVLTNNGWKKVFDVKFSDEVCTLNIKNNKVEFQRPIRLIKNKYKGKMYKLKTKRIDIFVTPNHKLLYSHCDFRKPPSFSLKEAEFLFNKSKRFKKDGIWIGKDCKYFTLPTVKIKHGSRYYSGFRVKKEKRFPIKLWLKFFGFWIAEGWTTEGKNGDYGVYLCNRNEKLLNEMKQLLEDFGYSICQQKDTIRTRDYQLFSYLKQFGKCYEKFIPKDVKSLSKELLEILFEYYIKGDGHIYGRTRKGLSATTTSIRLRDDLQEIALKMGISAYYKLHQKKGTPFGSPSQGKIYRQREDSWVIYFIRRNIHTVLPSAIKKHNYTESWTNYDGFVYCLEVPNHVIYIRRNGIPVWCGNSDPAMNWRLSMLDKFTPISNSDSHSPWTHRLGREANVFELEKLTYWEIIDAIKNRDRKKFLFTIETPPEYGKYHWDGHRNCKVFLEPKESIKYGNICPVCGKKLTIGVLHRVEELADRPEGFVPEKSIPFKTLIPLSELIAAVYDVEVFSRKVWEESTKMIKEFGSELNILLDVPEDKLRLVTNEKIVDLVLKNREGKVKLQPGYDGEYGFPLVDENSVKKSSRVQSSLTDF